MFELNCRFQIAAILVLLIIIIDYAKSSHLKLRSTKYFKALLTLTAINLCTDLMTVYTITHLTEETAAINKLFHQFFVSSVILTLLFEYLYIRSLASNQKRMTVKEFLLTMIPIVISAVVILRGNLEYIANDFHVYSYGPMAYAIYICGFIYLILGLKMAFSKKGYMTKEQRSSVLLGFVIWFGIMLVQVMVKYLLLSGLGFVLLVLAIYFSNENQKEYQDIETHCFNRNAFNKMLAENYAKRKPLFVINLTCENIERYSRIAGRDMAEHALVYLADTFEKHTGKQVYHSRSKVFSIFVMKDIKPFMDKLHSLEEELSQEGYSDFRLNCHISIMDVRKYTKSWCEVDDLIDFMTEKLQHASCKICFLNEDIVKDKKRKEQIDHLLDDAIENDGFEMYFQPIFNNKEKKFTSAEALIRLKNSGDLGFVSPEEFIPLAEEKGLILDIGDKVLDLVAKFAADHHLADTELEYIEVNLSAIQAVIPRLDERLSRIIEKYHLPATFINLEITETATVNFGATFANNINRLRNLGFSFSMDDFGTGYSNLAQMNQIHYNLVKLDKSLIWPAFDDGGEKAEVLLASVISLLKSIDVKIVAEGVETEEMVNYLIDREVEYLQGYYYSRPVSGEQFIHFMQEHA